MRQIRRALCAQVQKLYATERNDCADTVLSGDWRVAQEPSLRRPNSLRGFWSQVFDQPSMPDPGPFEATASKWSMLVPLAADEVTDALKQMEQTAPGLDRVTTSNLLKMNQDGPVQFLTTMLVLRCPTRQLSRRLTALSAALRAAEMRMNASKSASMTIVKDGKRKHLVLPQGQFEVDGSPLKSMNPVDEAKYLGLRFTRKGRNAERHTGKLNEMLGDLTKAPLKPHQRLELLRVFAIPKLVQDLTLGVAHRNTLKSLDRMIRERSITEDREGIVLKRREICPFYYVCDFGNRFGLTLTPTQPMLTTPCEDLVKVLSSNRAHPGLAPENVQRKVCKYDVTDNTKETHFIYQINPGTNEALRRTT
ncbi:unnamed protein product [Echinostoma caproni]|uniref:PAZ domain-containing protein n=1 Tax=Echinostoma caproni TaxID=27848 RepID=A0A183A873_9TREM|nr:unnamed protein product [Echinostoma caproni]